MPVNWQSVKRLLVVALEGSAGVGAAIPLLARLRAALPEAVLGLWVDEKAGIEAGNVVGPEHVLATVPDWSSREQTEALIARLHERGYDAAIFLTSPGMSPYPAAYICYLAGIPIRIGASSVFGGGILSHRIVPRPPRIQPSRVAYYKYLIEEAGIPGYRSRGAATSAGEIA